MFLLDENITKDQAELLRNWKLKGKQIGVEIKFKGIQDEQIITFLQQHNSSIFLTRDSDFCYQKFCHPNYSIIYLAVNSTEVAFYVKKLLLHQRFNSNKKLLGKVITVNQSLVHYWQFKSHELITLII